MQWKVSPVRYSDYLGDSVHNISHVYMYSRATAGKGRLLMTSVIIINFSSCLLQMLFKGNTINARSSRYK